VSEIRIVRRGRVQAATVGTASSSSSTIRVDDMAAATVYVSDADTAATTLTVWAAAGPEDAFLPLVGIDGSDVLIALSTAGSRAYSLPTVVAGARFVRLVSDADIGTSATVSVSVKS